MKNTINISNGSTVKWKEKLIKLVEQKISDNRKIGVHLAIFTEPFLSLLLKGEKTVESRFSLKKSPPFEKVNIGDIVLIKKSGGDVLGYFFVSNTQYYHSPQSEKIENLRKTYSREIGSHAVNNFWEARKDCKYISFFHVSVIKTITPIKIQKKDRTAWSVLRLAKNSQLIET